MRPLTRPPFNVADWYWIVAGSNTQVYGTVAGNFVGVSDPAYLAWLGRGNTPTKIDTEANLGDVLAAFPNLRPTVAGVLDGYKASQAANIVATTIFKVLFNHENRLRAIERALSLNGSPANLTQQQAVAAVKALM